MMTKVFLVSIAVLSLSSAFAGIPPGYYDPAAGLYGEALQWALHDIIDDHTAISYSDVWLAFYTTDDKYGNSEIAWDMYSNYDYYLGTQQGGSASQEGQGYNREHSWPKSWFGDQYPMNTDLFHIVPTDIYVNNRRSNYPYAEVGTTTWVSQNGSKLGYSVTPGYSGMAFEPIDEYKGDFARNYFYMATRYKGEDAGWPGSAMADGADLEPWAVNMLLEWSQSDPVSTKEIERNDAVYEIQNNRNPFIDHPEYAQYVYNSAGIEQGVEPAVLHMTVSPNPFTTHAAIQYCVTNDRVVSLCVYDVTGRLVSTLLNGVSVAAGSHVAVWGASGNEAGEISPGIYFAVLSTQQERLTTRMVCTGF